MPKTTWQNEKNASQFVKKCCLRQAKSLATLGTFIEKQISHHNSNNVRIN